VTAAGTVREVLRWIDLGLFSLVAVVALRQWRLHGGRAGLWAALAFVVLALVVDVGWLLPDEPATDLELVAERLLVGVLVLFPYLLYRFTAAFRPPPRRLERFLGLMTLVILVWTFLVPDFPEEGAPRPASFIAYLVAFVVHWTVLTVVVSVRLYRAGLGQPSVARKRMHMFAFAACAITLALILAVPGGGEGYQLAVAVATTLSALAFLVGLAPPAFLRFLWRRPEQRPLQEAIADLMRATTAEDVASRVLEPMGRIVGARAMALWDSEGRLVGAVGDPGNQDEDALDLEIEGNRLRVWQSRYAPYFGDEERRSLLTLGAMMGLALDRTRLFAHQRHFVALAAHELRSPVGSIHGLVETIHKRADDLAPEELVALHEALRRQSGRVAILVEQLLDLSRLDTAAIELAPQPFPVRERVEELVDSLAAERAAEFALKIAPDLEAVADVHAFDRVVGNLVANALRYGAPPVTVSAEQRDRHFRLVVEDRGPGVPAGFVPSLFERFARDEGSRDVTGTGLGLAIARSYARAQRGELLYEPATPRGARFELVLPREAEGGAVRAHGVAGAIGWATRKSSSGST
jgi:signal transduction histidine kinase